MGTIAQLCPAIFLQIRHVSTIGKKPVKQQYLHMSAQHGKLQPTNGRDPFTSLGHPSKFQRVSRLAFVTAATSLTGGQPNFARCLAVSCAGTLYVHFRGLLPPDGILPGANSLYIQVLHSPILAALLHATRASGTRNGITELSQRALPIFGCVVITLGIGPHSSLFSFVTCNSCSCCCMTA